MTSTIKLLQSKQNQFQKNDHKIVDLLGANESQNKNCEVKIFHMNADFTSKRFKTSAQKVQNLEDIQNYISYCEMVDFIQTCVFENKLSCLIYGTAKVQASRHMVGN